MLAGLKPSLTLSSRNLLSQSTSHPFVNPNLFQRGSYESSSQSGYVRVQAS
ncbi:hypothetical protein VCRLGP107_520110 [Vibrio crassostreae]|nr:hypothetical protein VCRLGP107_520110 [Vibrio crassostreae]